MVNVINYICLLAFTATLSSGYKRSGKVIRHFEALDYETKYKQAEIGRLVDERSSTAQEASSIKVINIEAFGRKFKLILRSKDISSFPFDIEIKGNINTELNLNSNTLVAGSVYNDKLSSVYGWITESGFFYGTVKSQNETYYIEPANKYFISPRFHSLMYRSKDNTDDLGDLFNFINYGNKKRANSKHHISKRRSSTHPEFKTNPKICRLSLEADFAFLKMMGSTLDSLNSMINHVEVLNRIFYRSFVNRDMSTHAKVFELHRNLSMVQFQIARVRVYNESETVQVLGPTVLDAATFLRHMQNKGGYSHYCLGLFFTGNSFNDGVLGVAKTGGICTNLNVGVVSFKREGVALPPLLTEIAVAHVVGHAFGAKHDEDSCHSESLNKDDHFIMTKFGLDADLGNHFVYSPCTVRQIKSFLNTLPEKGCFKLDSPSLCGNAVVEHGEECDCGGDEMCKDLEPGNCCDFGTCKLRVHAECSVSNGSCCDGKTCRYKNAGEICSVETECSDQAVCNGNTSICPEPSHKENFSECNWNSSICMNGVCSGKSVCGKFGLQPCFCKDKSDECKICCLSKGKCFPAQNITKIKSRLKSIYLSAGSLCSSRRGYCDVFHDCHRINLNAPFSNRYDPYFRKKSIKEITHSFWWAIFLGRGKGNCPY
ncbi:disintegrin and metalloproteinase domain-containing protein 10-like isoform X2 [Dendronephthya gigantea]|uniref:disintegrin and metalloproteinase domain-containing protein 10-like isoform X2 n=1 Tax=Dendronephthya gigantea TaxID=151771 RepID=UPI0010698D5C|nr:disintegrin and metalloproteinase domain-containing protein 10-like isoform X2 [Dendronephthya gigantea]